MTTHICDVDGCSRTAFHGHRHCCRECRQTGGALHGWRCAQRQPRTAWSNPTSSSEFPSGKEDQTKMDAVAHVKALVPMVLSELLPEQRKRWLLDMQRAFHADRYGAVQGHHEISVFLNAEIAALS